MKRKIGENNRSIVFKRLEGIVDAANALNINIEIDGKGLAGYEFSVDGKCVLWENMNRKQQIFALNSFMQGYELFRKFLKEE